MIPDIEEGVLTLPWSARHMHSQSPMTRPYFVHPLFACLLTTCLTHATALAQQTLVVGVGQQFATISSAIAAAKQGDTVLVKGGYYTESVVITRGMYLLGQNGATLSSVANVLTPEVQIINLPADEVVVFAGFDLRPATSLLTSNTRRLSVAGCRGSVAIADLSASGNYASWFVQVADSTQVHFATCRLGRTQVTDSHVGFDECQVHPPSDFFPSLLLDSGLVLITGGEVSGSSLTAFGTVLAGPAVSIEGGTLVATRTTLRAGPATPMSPDVSAVTSTDGLLLLDPSTVLIPAGAAVSISGPAFTANVELTSTSADVTGTQLTLNSHGPAGRPFGIVFGPPSPTVGTPWGLTWIDPAAASLLLVAAFDSNRENTFAIALPSGLPIGLTIALQPLVFDVAQLRLGMPTFATIR